MKVMQSDRNSFWGDVVFNSFQKTSMDEDNILDHIYKFPSKKVWAQKDCSNLLNMVSNRKYDYKAGADTGFFKGGLISIW